METTTRPAHRPTAGDLAPSISLRDVDGELVNLAYGDHAASVVVFTSNGCPYALAWHDRIQRLAVDYSSRGVQLVQVVSNDDHLQPNDSVEGMRTRAERGEVAGTYLRDARQAVARSFGATATPEVFVIDESAVIRYHGAPDGDHDDPAQSARFVRDALDAVLAGERVQRATTSPAGCSVKWRVELLWWEGCPSHRDAEELLVSVLEDLGRGDVRVERVEVASPSHAQDRGFTGSPTFHVGEQDLFPVGEAAAGLACRVYQRADGRISPLPAKDELTERLRDALARPWDLPGWADFRKSTSPTIGA